MCAKKFILEAIIMTVINLFANDMYGAGKGILGNIKKKKIKNKLKDEIKSDLLKQYGSMDLYIEVSRVINNHTILDDTYQRCYSIENHDFKTNDEFIKSIADRIILNQYDSKSIQDAVKYIFDKTFNVLNKSMSEDTRITINEIRIVRNDIKRLSSNVEELSNDVRLNDNQKLSNLDSENKKLNSENNKLMEEKKEDEKEIERLSILLQELEEKINRMEGNGITKLISWFKSKFKYEKGGKKNLAIIQTTTLVLIVIVLGLFWMSLPKKREITTEFISYSDISLDYLKNVNTTDSETIRIDFYDVVNVNNLKVTYNDAEVYEYEANYFDILPEYLNKVISISVSAYDDKDLIETIKLDNVYVVNDYNTSRIASGVERIYFKGSVNKSMLSDLTNNENLVEIFFFTGNDLTSDILNGLVNLKSIYIRNTDEKDVKFVKNISSLENLKIYSDFYLKNINALEHLSNLRILKLNECSNISTIKGITWLTNLVSLTITDSNDLTDISHVKNLINLEYLNFDDCGYIEDISVLRNLTELKYIFLTYCERIESIGALESLTKLKTLNLSNSSNFDIRELLALSFNIEKLGFDTPMVSSDLNDFCNKFTNLKVLYLNDCSKINDLSHLNKLVNLESLRIESYDNSENLNSLDFSNSFAKLHTLELMYCSALTDISFMYDIENLEYLNLHYCGSLKDIRPLAELSNLEYLRIHNCTSITDYSPLDNLTDTIIYGVEGY